MPENKKPLPSLPQELHLQIAGECVPPVLAVKVRFVGGKRRGERAWILECLNGRDWAAATSWYCFSFAQQDVLKSIREKTVLAIDLSHDQRQAYPLDMRLHHGVRRDGTANPISDAFLGQIPEIEITGLRLYHIGSEIHEKSDFYRADNNKHLERYTIKLNQADDGRLSLHSTDREILNVCSALSLYDPTSTEANTIGIQRVYEMDHIRSQIQYHFAQAETLGCDMVYIIGSIVSGLNGNLGELREWIEDGNGGVVAVACTSVDATRVFKAVEDTEGAFWEKVEVETEEEEQ